MTRKRYTQDRLGELARKEMNRQRAGEIGIELAKHILLIPGTGERDLEIDVIKMPTPTQWASVCWAAQSVIKKLGDSNAG
jgi:hypothetical protein